MAEFLIFIRTADTPAGHWMDRAGVYAGLVARIDNSNLTVAQKVRKKAILSDKYGARLQPGDIIEAHENGFYRDHGWNRRCFAVVRCPTMGLAIANTYVKPYMVVDRVVSKREYTLASLNLGPGDTHIMTVAGFTSAVGTKHG